ncbi:hypothetical protein [Pistricoccus aurantiacus]|uniref:hypothetical protein n=1 Tax=Pistricoccus aurantiacus TaxID=1883414 RepID=UPI0036355CA3
MKQPIAVLTGDIIASKRIKNQHALFERLDTCLGDLAARFDGRGERYRGDGFQLVLNDHAHALHAAVMLRAWLIMHSDDTQRWDARVAVAIGLDEWDRNVTPIRSSGPVFIESGRALDSLSQDQAHLRVVPTEQDRDSGLALLTRFVDELIDGWSIYSAEVVYWQLVAGESQQALGKRLGIRQPSVHKRLRAARWPLLSEYLNYVHEDMKARYSRVAS